MFSAYPRRGSDTSDCSTSYSDDCSSKGSVPDSVPSLIHHTHSVDSEFDSPPSLEVFDTEPRASALTYCSTVASSEDLEDDDFDDYPHIIEPPAQSESVPATPQEFSELFPCTKRLIIKHDDSTLDGNMNLRVDMDTTKKGQDKRVTLFHLRMYELRNRDFSIRRYGRDCGREVCHVKRKLTKPSTPRPNLQRSVSKVLGSFRGKHDAEEPQRKLERQDSGYHSTGDEEEEACKPTISKPTNTCGLEFSNYAHVDITRRGVKSTKKYDFEYWGKSYSWKRSMRPYGASREASFQLINNSTGDVVAYIRPDPLEPAMAAIEEAKGGFVPPSSMFILNSTTDPVNRDNADVAEFVSPHRLLMSNHG